jgi:hypothetical protein
MKKLLSYLWLPITAAAVLVLVYGGLTIADLKIKNQKLEENQNKLETRITQLEKNGGNAVVAASKEEMPKEERPSATRKILATTDQPRNPSVVPASSASPTTKTTPTSPSPSAAPTPTPAPTATPTPTPTPTPVEQATVAIENAGVYTVNLQTGDTAFSLLLRAGNENGFSVDYQTYEGLGAFVTCIAGLCGHDNYYWAFYYNGSYSQVGASAQSVKDGDETAWKFESF